MIPHVMNHFVWHIWPWCEHHRRCWQACRARGRIIFL